jgi:rfaE bifunctional protein nucleotidyltransferase chain/domain
MTSTSATILGRSEVAPFAADARSEGHRVILANGCFDLIHAGHVRYLAGAKALGGKLLVAINSDRQVRMLKGEGRPFLPEAERAEIVAAFRWVDAVTIFDEPTVEELVRLVRPDLHAKGTDYTTDSVPERAVVIECGGQVAIVGDPKDHSSTKLFRSVRGLTGD